MSGKKGMIHKKINKNFMRYHIWQSMRVLRRFTIPDLCRTSGAGYNNVKKFLHVLRNHGYVAPFGKYIGGGRAGEYKGWRLVRDIGPDYPIHCDRCGNPLSKPCKAKGEIDGPRSECADRYGNR